MHGIEIEGGHGADDGINKPLYGNKGEQIEQELAADIFREHQELQGTGSGVTSHEEDKLKNGNNIIMKTNEKSNTNNNVLGKLNF